MSPGQVLLAVLLVVGIWSGVRQVPIMWALANHGTQSVGTVLDTGWGILWPDLTVELPNAGQMRVVHVGDAFLFRGQAGDEISVLVAPDGNEATRAGFFGLLDVGVEILSLAIMGWLLWKIFESTVP